GPLSLASPWLSFRSRSLFRSLSLSRLPNCWPPRSASKSCFLLNASGSCLAIGITPLALWPHPFGTSPLQVSLSRAFGLKYLGSSTNFFGRSLSLLSFEKRGA